MLLCGPSCIFLFLLSRHDYTFTDERAQFQYLNSVVYFILFFMVLYRTCTFVIEEQRERKQEYRKETTQVAPSTDAMCIQVWRREKKISSPHSCMQKKTTTAIFWRGFCKPNDIHKKKMKKLENRTTKTVIIF